MVKPKKNPPPQTNPSDKKVQLVCSWWEGKVVLDNGLNVRIDQDKGIKFELNGRSSKEEGYSNLLCAKVFQTFGVYSVGVAISAFMDCINCIITGSSEFNGENLDEINQTFQRRCAEVLSLFQELGPRDVTELMMVTKMIILHHLSNKELIAGSHQYEEKTRTYRQSRGMKLSRLLLEFKEKLDKHRIPHQQINVQHNHV